jgi:hypothetical protein
MIFRERENQRVWVAALGRAPKAASNRPCIPIMLGYPNISVTPVCCTPGPCFYRCCPVKMFRHPAIQQTTTNVAKKHQHAVLQRYYLLDISPACRGFFPRFFSSLSSSKTIISYFLQTNEQKNGSANKNMHRKRGSYKTIQWGLALYYHPPPTPYGWDGEQRKKAGRNQEKQHTAKL